MSYTLMAKDADGNYVEGICCDEKSVEKILDYWESLSSELKMKVAQTNVLYDHADMQSNLGSVESLLEERKIRLLVAKLRDIRMRLINILQFLSSGEDNPSEALIAEQN